MGEKLSVEFGSKTILELRALMENGHLNLEPGFKRKSVWTISDRRKLIQSVMEGFPVPSIFLYKREDDGQPVYDVLDGKQRLETIFMFARVNGFKNRGFDVKFQFPDDEEPCIYAWRALEKNQSIAAFLTYKFQVAEVSGDFADIVELFVRINSTGKALTSSEKRHARFYTSVLLKHAEKLARQYRPYLTQQEVVSNAAIDRMRDVELVSELLVSIINGGPIHKKKAVDKAVGNTAIHASSLNKSINEFKSTISSLRQMFPELRTTRFQNISEFYSLFLVLWEMKHQRNLILGERSRNRLAMEILSRFSTGVDEVKEQLRRAVNIRPHQRLFADYLFQVQQSTDALPQRTRRADMIRNLLAGVFERKDDRRIFSVEQRRILWNSEEEKTCSGCREPLTWINFQVDHIKPYSKGGMTTLTNAALICAECNAAKGAK
jgi:5-methylcytosine-specific restriction endonuclease McrA